MKKNILFSLTGYMIFIILCINYCQATNPEIVNLISHTIVYSFIVLFITIALVLFVKSDHHISILGIIPSKYYLYMATCILVVIGLQSLVTMISTQSLRYASMFLPIVVAFDAGYYLKSKFDID